jgi:hypothetical protein
VPESDKLGRNPAKSGRHRRILEIPCQTGQSGWVSGNLAGSRPDNRITSHLVGILDESGRLAGIPAESCLDLARKAGSARFLPDSSKDRRNPAKMARSRQLCQNLYLPNIKKIFFYYFILTFFILGIKFIFFN